MVCQERIILKAQCKDGLIKRGVDSGLIADGDHADTVATVAGCQTVGKIVGILFVTLCIV
jgi:hypothetical protein